MLEIVSGGEVAPGAEQVAARADVGLRTVFRHFQDMDSLYREMSLAIEREASAIVEQPFVSPDWRDRVTEIIGRRAAVFERIGPFKRASNAFLHRSKFLEADNARFAVLQREMLTRELPPAVVADEATLEILDLLLSFETWSRLRHEQRLSPDAARETLEVAVRKLIA